MKHGLATRSNESSIFAYAEDIWEKIDRLNICRSELFSKLKIKNTLRMLAFNLINIVDTRIYKDSNIVKIIQELRKHVALLKQDKGNGIVLFNMKDYTDSVEHLFKDRQKFQILNTNPTIT